MNINLSIVDLIWVIGTMYTWGKLYNVIVINIYNEDINGRNMGIALTIFAPIIWPILLGIILTD